MNEILFSAAVYEDLLTALLTERRLESKAYVLAKAVTSELSLRLLAHSVIKPEPEAYEARSAGRIVIEREWFHQLLLHCRAERLSLIEAHSHPWANQVRFSSIDIPSNARKFHATSPMYPPFHHGALVFGKDRSFEGELWNPIEGSVEPVSQLRVIGPHLKFLLPTASERHRTSAATLSARQKEVFDRTILAFGEPGQRMLRRLRVAVVGAGGLGHLVAIELALLGVGEITLIDPDRLDVTNANRFVAAPIADARRKPYKVHALARFIRRLVGRQTHVVAVRGKVQSPSALRLLRMADVMFGCTDSHQARVLLNGVSAAYLVPFIDIGVGIHSENGRVQLMAGQVRTVLPGYGPCLTCMGGYDPEAASAASLDPQGQEEFRRRGYIKGENIAAPSVISLNGTLASIAVTEFLKLVSGLAEPAPYLFIDALNGMAFPPRGVERNPECGVCGQDAALGVGDEILPGNCVESSTAVGEQSVEPESVSPAVSVEV